MSELKITDVKVFLTQPGGSRLIVVKVNTSEPGLYGLGCATFTQRCFAVATAVERHLGPFVMGKDPRNIEDIWQSAMLSGYWRNGPVLNNAISGIDMALWDIKGKLANMPCYELWGGKCRPAAAAYGHAGGQEPQEVADSVRKFLERGYKYVRCQISGYSGKRAEPETEGALPGGYFRPRPKLHQIPAMFEHLRKELGDDVELLHDVHERLAPVDAVWLAKALEPYRLFFLEDLLAPEDIDWFRHVRSICATPMAMGELFNNPREMTPLIAERLIDFIRVHISQIGGASPSLKLAHLCEAFGVRTAWHGPGDVSPVGMAANVHLDIACHNFGIQEWSPRNEKELEVFPGMPEFRDGYLYPNEKPGWGMEFNEELAAKYPCREDDPRAWVARIPDGTVVRP